MTADDRRYIVAGKDVKAGVPGSDSENSDLYFELGWEVTTTYLQLVHGRRTGAFTGAEVIVTASGREFLYRDSFSTVIAFREFQRLGVDPSRVRDLVKEVNELYFGDTWLRKLRLRALYLKWFHYWRYRIGYSGMSDALPMARPPLDAFPVAEKFYCICIRFRDHQPQRNLPAEYLLGLLDLLSDTPCFLVGHGSDALVRHARHRVCSLAEFAALARHPKCRAVIGSMTGTIQLAQMLHHGRLVVIDLDDHYRLWGPLFPSVLSDLCNFPPVTHSVYNYRPSVEQVVRDLSVDRPESRIAPESYAGAPRFFDAERRHGHAFFEHDSAT